MKLTIYRIFTFLLLPVAFMFSIAIVMLLGSVLNNAAALLIILFAGCIVYYTFSTLRFLTSGIDGNKVLSANAKRRIRFTAIISVVFGLLSFSEYVTLFIKPAMMNDILNQVSTESLKSVNVTEEQLITYLKGFFAFMLAYTVILLIHTAITFEYLKQYSFLFSDYNNDDEANR